MPFFNFHLVWFIDIERCTPIFCVVLVDSLTVSPFHLQHHTLINVTFGYSKDVINVSSHQNNSDKPSDATKLIIITLFINTVFTLTLGSLGKFKHICCT
jgi:hypothetical protein